MKKRDGTTEVFHPEKIIRVLLAAGLSESDALQTAQTISQYLHSLHKKTVASLLIRDRVQLELDARFPYTAGLYRWYQKTKV